MNFKTLTSKKLVNTINPSSIKVTLSIYGMLISLMKTLDEFEDGPSGTPLRALKNTTP